ncbi:MAG: hypothetical protein WC088_01775 [Candidatus Izemoplasmatales bacterium]|jgi:hypothetical protein|nr:hypothetical protein [Candidatus Izemoplasmatales bacterium]MDD4595287.1 hypothetical protein [Candidatus Izemoplasmatales bacterium]
MPEKTIEDYQKELKQEITDLKTDVDLCQEANEIRALHDRKEAKKIKNIQSILSIVTGGTFITTIFVEPYISVPIGAVASGILLYLNASSKITQYADSAALCWKASTTFKRISRDYRSLISETEVQEPALIRKRIDELKAATCAIDESFETLYKNEI